MADAKKILKEFEAVKARRSVWEKVLELAARYVCFRKQGFGSETTDQGFYVHGDVFDDTAALANSQMVSSIAGALWKNGARTFRIVKPESVTETPEVKTYYQEVNRRVVYQMEHKHAGFGTAFQEYLLENGALGTSGLGIFKAPKGADHKVDYRAMGLKHLWIVEDASGRVVKIFYETELDAFQIEGEYGSSVARSVEAIKQCLDSFNYSTKFKILWVIRPNESYNPTGVQNNQNYPIESIHILEKEKLEIKASGFKSMPIKVTRFYKNEGQEYGYCPGIEALPSIITLNAFWELITAASEKNLKPPLWMLDDGSFGGGILDTSPDAVNVLDSTSRISSGPPIGVISTVGEMQSTLKVIEALITQVIKHFMVDRLLDLNNQTRMTLGEAQIRNELRSDSLGAVYNRQIDECLTPSIERSIELFSEDGYLGVAKDSVEEAQVLATGKKPLIIPMELLKAQAEGVEIYNINYISPAARVLRSEELRGVMSTWQFAGAFGQAVPEFLLMLDKKASMRLVAELSGAVEDVFLADTDYTKALDAYMSSKQQQAEMMFKQMQAEIAAKMGSANQQNAQANATKVGSLDMAGAGGVAGMGEGMLL